MNKRYLSGFPNPKGDSEKEGVVKASAPMPSFPGIGIEIPEISPCPEIKETEFIDHIENHAL